jgi:hypothetical protein
MANYQVATIECPPDWTPGSLDDVPSVISGRPEFLGPAADLLAAVRQATEHNERPAAARNGRWAVVFDRDSSGRQWPSARLCTPIRYKVASIWRPEGWEPSTARDVPYCLWRAQGQIDEETLSYERAVDTVRSLNQQSIDNDGTHWYAVLAVENEPLSQSIAFDIQGTETTTLVRRLHVVAPAEAGSGDCSHCPAHVLECPRAAQQ